jgi:hypothetical protein
MPEPPDEARRSRERLQYSWHHVGERRRGVIFVKTAKSERAQKKKTIDFFLCAPPFSPAPIGPEVMFIPNPRCNYFLFFIKFCMSRAPPPPFALSWSPSTSHPTPLSLDPDVGIAELS